MPQNVAIYCRISKEDTDENRRGLGLKRQEKDCRLLAEAKGWKVADVFVDDDISAYVPGKRPKYAALLDAIKAGSIDGLIVYDLDRLHRHPWELETFFQICDGAKFTDLASVSGDFDLGTNDGRLMARIMGAVAKKSSDDAARRLRRKHEEIALAGRPSGGGSRPFGYQSDQITIIDSEAEMIREAALRLLSGESMAGICRQWNEAGQLTGKGSQWRVASLRNMLLSGRLAGLREHHGEIVGEATWAPILDRVTWERVRAFLTDPSRQQLRPHRGSLLTGLARCGVCGAKLVVAPVQGRTTYRCAKSPGRPGCGGIAIVAGPFEEVVTEAVLIRLDTPALTTATRDRGTDIEQLKAATETTKLESKLAELADMWAAGEISRPEWLKARNGVETRLEHARRTASQHHRGTALLGLEAAGQLRLEWPELVRERRRAILAAIIDRITVAPARRGLNRFDSDRIDIVWQV